MGKGTSIYNKLKETDFASPLGPLQYLGCIERESSIGMFLMLILLIFFFRDSESAGGVFDLMRYAQTINFKVLRNTSSLCMKSDHYCKDGNLILTALTIGQESLINAVLGLEELLKLIWASVH